MKCVWKSGGAAVVALACVMFGCGGGDGGSATTQSVALRFAAVDGTREVSCGDTLEGLGPDGEDRVEVSDLRLYVSNVRFVTANGDRLPLAMSSGEFQYVDDAGSVALIDLTGTNAGACAGDGLTYPEGTARTNSTIHGTAAAGEIAALEFDVGIPQRLMKTVIANQTAEDAPSPLAEMHWSWGYAYRFLVMNFTLADGAGTEGEGYVHVGSTDCGGDGSRALTDRDACGLLNTAAVSLSGFDPQTDVVGIDVRRLLAHLNFTITPVDGDPVPGVACHSSAEQVDCADVFGNLGIDLGSGNSQATLNRVFTIL